MQRFKQRNSETARMLTIEGACNYINMGETSARKWLKDIGAARHFGRSIRYDRNVIDEVLDKVEE